MRKVLFWSMTAVLVVVAVGSAVLWVRSYEQSDQAVVRLGTPGVSVWTTDRGRLGVLFLGPQPLGDRFLLNVRTNDGPVAGAPHLEALCGSHGLGFGMDTKVNIAGLEMPAVAGVAPVTEGTWAARRVVAPFWAILAASVGSVFLLWMTLGVRIHRQDHGLCAKCAFDVTQCSHFCPKCGKTIPKKSWSGEARPARRAAAGQAVKG